jgi:hypothetical protein
MGIGPLHAAAVASRYAIVRHGADADLNHTATEILWLSVDARVGHRCDHHLAGPRGAVALRLYQGLMALAPRRRCVRR